MDPKTASTWLDCVKDVRQVTSGFKYVPDLSYRAACVTFEPSEGIQRMVVYVSRNWNNCAEPPCHTSQQVAAGIRRSILNQ